MIFRAYSRLTFALLNFMFENVDALHLELSTATQIDDAICFTISSQLDIYRISNGFCSVRFQPAVQ